jgi:hypothetical protein
MLRQPLRSVGYSTVAALTDLVDNSIAARTVRNLRAMMACPFVAISDDGCGIAGKIVGPITILLSERPLEVVDPCLNAIALEIARTLSVINANVMITHREVAQ